MNIALILSGGTGTRVGGKIPKQYITVCGRPVIGYCLEVFMNHPAIDAVQIVADRSWRNFVKECLEETDHRTLEQSCGETQNGQRPDAKWRGFSEPGENRQRSVLNGLEDILAYADREDVVIIHDAARPMVTEQFITSCLAAIKGHEGVLPVLPMKDTVYQSKGENKISSLLDRDSIFAGQAPEAFLLGRYYDANRAMLPDRILEVKGSTEPAVLAGMDVIMIDGDERNFKITTQQDLRRFQEIAASLDEMPVK